VGENAVDDGGNPASATPATQKSFYWLDHKALDWVWPQAATAPERIVPNGMDFRRAATFVT
jgi:hypothetical protein